MMSRDAIGKSTKHCPGCRTPTEKSGKTENKIDQCQQTYSRCGICPQFD